MAGLLSEYDLMESGRALILYQKPSVPFGRLSRLWRNSGLDSHRPCLRLLEYLAVRDQGKHDHCNLSHGLLDKTPSITTSRQPA